MILKSSRKIVPKKCSIWLEIEPWETYLIRDVKEVNPLGEKVNKKAKRRI